MLDIKENDFEKLTEYIKQNYGINLTKKRNLIEGRLSNLIIEKGFKSFKEYLDYVYSDKTGFEETVLINKLTTNHTFFMRESSHFEYYKDKVLPQINLKEKDLRIWSAGCSTGEEPYTLAMINNDFFGDKKNLYDTKILATDISVKALKTAENGIYSKEALNNLPPLWKLKYFYKDALNSGFDISDEIKNDVIFRVFNLMNETFPFKRKFHAIFCRNVMIYFDQETKNKLINKFYQFTEPGGYLFIGHSESINREMTNYKYIMPAVYQKEL